jgi:putative endonuclease
MKNYYIYILASQKNGTLYIGITSNLIKRIQEHKAKLVEGFTKKYNIDILVYYEQTTDINSALTREKALKKWNREWKIQLIEKVNPNWNDLYSNIIQ